MFYPRFLHANASQKKRFHHQLLIFLLTSIFLASPSLAQKGDGGKGDENGDGTGQEEIAILHEDDDLLLGIALSVNGRTPIGPFIVSLGAVNNDAWGLQLSIGRPMREGSIVDEIR